MTAENLKKLNIPSRPGCYRFYDKVGKILYVGKAANLRGRVLSYWRESAGHTPAKRSMVAQIEKIDWLETGSEIEALLLEANLIKKLQPPFNVVMRDDKRYIYLKISTDDEIPGLFATRKIDKSGKYFGPFTSALAVRQTLKAIRKIWPYCAERKRQAKPCFYYQIGLCTGICTGKISRAEYLEKVIKPIMLFFEGKKERIIRNYELRIKNCESLLKKKQTVGAAAEEGLVRLKFELKNMRHVLEHANIIGLGEKFAADVVELAKVLGLKKAPKRIEGYDIANIFGREAVGSMVVFAGGEPDKSEYRKFKIKAGQGKADDVRMLREVLERRMAHSVSPAPLPPPLLLARRRGDRWLRPDLIIIDGGKGQLSAALSVLKKFKADIPVIAISKGEGLRSALAPDKLFFPGEKKPLELPLASPALHLVKRVRDEAHRFAIGYHRKLRGKRFLGK